MTADESKYDTIVERLGRGRHLHRIIPIIDNSGKVIERIVKPLMVEVRAHDVVQIIVGSTLLAFPVGFTEETWNLGAKLPLENVLLLAFISVAFIALFVYLNFYRYYFKDYFLDYFKRVFMIYFLSLLLVAFLMTVIQQCPWGVDNLLAIKRILIVGFPASLSATITDSIK
ncbi:MAG: DUF2391 family protein [Deltaproteobacteria bacterium]|nr:DUF2391 family protein [Deltaproteobacteria bacterium]